MILTFPSFDNFVSLFTRHFNSDLEHSKLFLKNDFPIEFIFDTNCLLNVNMLE